MIADELLPNQLILDGLSQAVLIFDPQNHLVAENAAARALMGSDLKLIRQEGWPAAAVLFNSRALESVEAVRNRAIDARYPVRFYVYRTGERIPAWMSMLRHSSDAAFTMITIEMPDWTALTDIVDSYLKEVAEVVSSTRGHVDLIEQITRAKGNENLLRRVGGFTRLIHVHMHRLGRLTQLMDRLEKIRTGRVREQVAIYRRKVVLQNFIEDFLEAMDEDTLVDPESDAGDPRKRIRAVIPGRIAVAASTEHLSYVLRDILRNAIMYSMKAAPIKVVAYAHPRENTVQIDIIDEGYGIRASESDRVFLPYERSRQPQIMAEFGYGLAMYLCKSEVEAMNGRIWFESEEGVGTTFSIKLPAWSDDSSSG
ncbi:MAG: sensor histidine kinase [Chloroflexi bacterium]|uniref:sensor histidine kinase n=1 Tax=Candidatus Flexifilum breve TaxID=3140694 RepID=UPI003136EB0A|nr:sensor histidine kinase [Chloroflexota bacterium]